MDMALISFNNILTTIKSESYILYHYHESSLKPPGAYSFSHLPAGAY